MDDAAFNTESVAADQLKAFIERIERLEEEKAGIAGDIKDVYAEAKGSGFDIAIMRQIIHLRFALAAHHVDCALYQVTHH